MRINNFRGDHIDVPEKNRWLAQAELAEATQKILQLQAAEEHAVSRTRHVEEQLAESKAAIEHIQKQHAAPVTQPYMPDPAAAKMVSIDFIFYK